MRQALFQILTIASIVIITGMVSQASSQEYKVLIIGDSITSGLGVSRETAYPSLVQDYLDREMLAQKKPGVRIINAGISGSTTAGAYSRLKWYLKAKPAVLILALGANDGLRGLSVTEMEKNLDKAIVLAKASGIKVVIAGMEVPPNYGPDYSAAFRAVFPELAARHNIPLIPFLLAGVGGVSELNQADGIHPNARGHEIIAKTVLPYILEAL
jgi:acyl-CoA thioesterase-1